jgi:hypothetical protein
VTEYTIRCNSGVGDVIVAYRESGSDSVKLKGTRSGEFAIDTYATSDTARTFARGILALADEIDGGEVAEAAPPARTPVVGDKVRVAEDDAFNRRGEFVGLVGTLKEIRSSARRLPYYVEFGTGSGKHGDPVNGKWYCAKVELVDEPDTAPDPEPSLSVRGEFVVEAQALLVGKEYTAMDLVTVAAFLSAP